MRLRLLVMLELSCATLGGTDAGSAVDAGACMSCDGHTGLCAPQPTCSAAAPCPGGLVGLSTVTLAEVTTIPHCKTSSATRPLFDDGPPRRWSDALSGEPRAACVFTPTGAVKRPLVLYLHGAGGSADTLYDNTSLRSKAATFDLTGDPQRAGFVLAADQGRNLRSANGNAPAARHDTYYRQLPSNPDVRNLDRLIDELVKTGTVDEQRIFLIGWSNGAFFAQLYGLWRHETPTPDGHRVAAVAVFDGANPYEPPDDQSPGCTFRPYPRSTLPVFLVHRACSIVPCDAAQATALKAPPGYDVSAWIRTLKTDIGSPNVTEVIISGMGTPATCTSSALCTTMLATLNHVRWPDDGSGLDAELQMLAFFKAHPLQ